MAALVAAREVNAGLAAPWDAGAGQAWSRESILTGQKLIEQFLWHGHLDNQLLQAVQESSCVLFELLELQGSRGSAVKLK